jgi:hypothetical protein
MKTSLAPPENRSICISRRETPAELLKKISAAVACKASDHGYGKTFGWEIGERCQAKLGALAFFTAGVP